MLNISDQTLKEIADRALIYSSLTNVNFVSFSQIFAIVQRKFKLMKRNYLQWKVDTSNLAKDTAYSCRLFGRQEMCVLRAAVMGAAAIMLRTSRCSATGVAWGLHFAQHLHPQSATRQMLNRIPVPAIPSVISN